MVFHHQRGRGPTAPAESAQATSTKEVEIWHPSRGGRDQQEETRAIRSRRRDHTATDAGHWRLAAEDDATQLQGFVTTIITIIITVGAYAITTDPICLTTPHEKID